MDWREQYPASLDGPPNTVSDPRELLLSYVEWYREAVMRKIGGLSDEQLRTPVEPLSWSPLAVVKHLGWVERRWMRWGFDAEEVEPAPPGGEVAEWSVDPAESTEQVIQNYFDEVERTRELVAQALLHQRAKLGGRFVSPDEAPPLARILFHLLQEYARHTGHVDIARELIDGTTGE